MKTRMRHYQMIRHGLVLTALLAGTFLAPALRAQPAAPKVDSRFLLIFDTSTDMRQRLSAVQNAVNTLLATSVYGQLHSGDSVGVWTFDRDLHAGLFPLQYWKPDDAPITASNIIKFVKKQHYLNKTDFVALLPALNQVVQHSERLTVLIFCDGKGEIHGTPYDTGINQIFQQRQRERQKERSPFVIGLRSQHGQYVGCMVSFPPEPVTLPIFPPLPLPEVAPAPPVADAPPPPSPPRSSAPPLIIIGMPRTNHVSPVLKPAPTNSPSVTAISTPAMAATNKVETPEIVPGVQTSAVPVQPDVTAAPVMTAKAAAPPESSRTGLGKALAVGVAFLAGGLVVFVFMSRRTR